jgi:N-acetylated-alpha-linked acidic dipeptidase
MASESTPLIAAVSIAPARERYPHSTLRRFCTIALGATLLVVVVLFLLPLAWLGHPDGRIGPWFGPPEAWPESSGIKYRDLQRILLETPQEDKAREWSKYYTAGPHLAGKNLSQAAWTRDRWQELGVESRIIAYDVYINYPVGHRLALLEASGGGEEGHEKRSEQMTAKEPVYAVKYECAMEEDVLGEDPTTSLPDRIPTFHGYSANGNVTGRYVYANFGTFDDFEDLVKANVSLRGNIALVKHGKVHRGLKVKRAQELGMIGVVIYTDPQGDGEVTEENGYEKYPKGPARNPSSVERGSTHFSSMAPGDPTTPGYPSKPGVPRQDPHAFIPSIPSVPISYADALPILKALNGHGPKATDLPGSWRGGGLGYKGVEYNIGPSPPELVLNLVNDVEYVTTPLWNVIGIINGTIPDEVVVLGNHRDAWIAGGAGDPNSGSAAMNEVIRSFGEALKKGWKPLRTIVFASWDGEEYGLVGSTEWVEEFLPWLSHSAVAYLNLDVGVVGPIFDSRASPLLSEAIYEATSSVRSPNQTVKGQTVRDLWDGRIGIMGSGSDFTAFQDFAGVPSADFSFRPGPKSPVYHYHSNYDSFHWMDKYGDPGWHYHAAITKVWSLLAAQLVEAPIIRFNVTDYAVGLGQYLERTIDKAKNSSATAEVHTRAFGDLKAAIGRLYNETTSFEAHAKELGEDIRGDIPWWKWWEKARLFHEVKEMNKKYKYFERQFLYEKGLSSRPWFKHVVFAPG